jgi:hypothetical protein
MARKVKTTVYLNAVNVRGENREIGVFKRKEEDITEESPAENVIHFKALISDVGPGEGARTEFSENGKIKYSYVGLTNDAVIELYMALHYYITKEII